MDMLEIERRLAGVITSLADLLPESELLDMRALVSAGEAGVAFENLCVQLVEHDVVIKVGLKRELQVLGTSMGIAPDHWEQLSVS